MISNGRVGSSPIGATNFKYKVMSTTIDVYKEQDPQTLFQALNEMLVVGVEVMKGFDAVYFVIVREVIGKASTLRDAIVFLSNTGALYYLTTSKFVDYLSQAKEGDNDFIQSLSKSKSDGFECS